MDRAVVALFLAGCLSFCWGAWSFKEALRYLRLAAADLLAFGRLAFGEERVRGRDIRLLAVALSRLGRPRPRPRRS